MKWRLMCIGAVGWLCMAAHGQGVMGSLSMGKLVDPKVGAWAWYDLKGATEDEKYLVRLALVGEEKVGGKNGYWLELEVVPSVGYSSFYTMLLTEPGNEPSDIHKMFQREGANAKEEVPVKPDSEAKASSPGPERKQAGEEDVTIGGKNLRVQHYEVQASGKKIDIWMSNDVRPMGIVQITSSDGSLMLRDYGIGGPEARSKIDEPLPQSPDGKGGVKVDVRVEKGSARDGAKPKATEDAPKAKTPKGKLKGSAK